MKYLRKEFPGLVSIIAIILEIYKPLGATDGEPFMLLLLAFSWLELQVIE